MTKNPLINAFSATMYISLVAAFMYYGPKHIESTASIMAPIAMLSLFVFSTAVMGYIFCLKPLTLFMSGNKEEGIMLFIKTLGYFGLITLSILSTLFLM